MAAPVPVPDLHDARQVMAGMNQQEGVAALCNTFLALGPALAPLIEALPDVAAAQGIPAYGRVQKDALRTALAQIGTQVETVRTAADVAHQTSKGERLPPIMTTMPPAPAAGAAPVPMPNFREYKIPEFSGSDEEKGISCLDWLTRVVEQAETSALTYLQTIQLMRRHSSGPAAKVIETAHRTHDNLEETIRNLEIRFAGLKAPEEARDMVNVMTRNADEPIAVFATRVRHMAFMATRALDNSVEKELELTKTNVMRCLRGHTKFTLQEREKTRKLQGETEFTISAFVAAIEDLETRSYAAKKQKVQKVLKVAASDVSEVEVPEVEDDLDDDGVPFFIDSDSAEEEEVLVARVAPAPAPAARNPNASRGRAPTKSAKTSLANAWKKNREVMKNLTHQIDAVAAFVRTTPPAAAVLRSPSPHPRQLRMAVTPERGRPQVQAQAQGQGRDAGQTDGRKRFGSKSRSPGRRVQFDPQRYNVTPDQCAKCGIAGHRAFDETRIHCVYRNHPLPPGPCTACTVGGHTADMCWRKARAVPPTGN